MAISYNDVKLFNESDYKKFSANALVRTRANNLTACSALSTYLDTEGEKETKSMQGYGLPTNVENPNETNEYYAALKFFRNNYEYFSKSQAMIKLRDLFSWENNEEYRKVVLEYYIGHKKNLNLLRDIKDIDLRKIATKFARNGNYKSGQLADKKDLEELDNQIAELFVAWKKDIVNFYNDEKARENDEDQK